jgi:pSer/pThr/pTyr-binding forkhead associated (FHA) protein
METTASLKALTPEARATLNGSLYEIPHFPFRVGRESRIGHTPDYPNSRRNSVSPLNNDLYLRETTLPLNVSREHFQIEKRNDGYYLVDRGSACGTLVEGVMVGGDRTGGERRLENGDVIVVGTSLSPHVFKFMLNGC